MANVAVWISTCIHGQNTDRESDATLSKQILLKVSIKAFSSFVQTSFPSLLGDVEDTG